MLMARRICRAECSADDFEVIRICACDEMVWMEWLYINHHSLIERFHNTISAALISIRNLAGHKVFYVAVAAESHDK